MNKLKYLFMATVLGFAFTACDDDNYGVLDGIGMITRSVSLAVSYTHLTLPTNSLV